MKREQPKRVGVVGGGGPNETRKVINVTLMHDVQLHTTQNAWKPSLMKKDETEGDKQTEVSVVDLAFRTGCTLINQCYPLIFPCIVIFLSGI